MTLMRFDPVSELDPGQSGSKRRLDGAYPAGNILPAPRGVRDELDSVATS